MVQETIQTTADEVWKHLHTPQTDKNILKGIINITSSMGHTPEQASAFIADLDKDTAAALGYLFGGVPDGEAVKRLGRQLTKEQPE